MDIKVLQNKLSPILRNYGVKQAAVFGSVSRGQDRPSSDVDLLITLGGQPMGMFKYMDLIEDMEKTLGRKVDLLTESSLNKFLKPYITPDLKTIYYEK